MFQGEYVALVRFVKDRAQWSPAVISQKGHFGCFSSSVSGVPSRYIFPEHIFHKARVYSQCTSDGSSPFHSFIKHVFENPSLRPHIEVRKSKAFSRGGAALERQSYTKSLARAVETTGRALRARRLRRLLSCTRKREKSSIFRKKRSFFLRSNMYVTLSFRCLPCGLRFR